MMQFSENTTNNTSKIDSTKHASIKYTEYNR